MIKKGIKDFGGKKVMLRSMLMVKACLILNLVINTCWANAIPTISACKSLKAYPLHPQENIIDFPKALHHSEQDESMLEDYYADIAIAYANEAKRLKQQAVSKRHLASQQKGRTLIHNLRHGKSCNPFSVHSPTADQQKNSHFSDQLKKEAAVLEKKRDEMLDKGKYFLCVAENTDQILSTKDSR